MTISERPLTSEEKNEFERYATQARANLGMTDSNIEPNTIVQKLNDFVDQWQQERSNPFKRLLSRKPDPIDVALGLGVVWGDQIVRAFGWEWVCVLQDGQELYGVVSPNRTLVIFPTYFLKACLENPKMDCTAMLAFNMLRAGNLPELPPNGYESLMHGVQRIIPKK